MGIKEYSLEMRGMPRRDLEEYFLSIGGELKGKGRFLGPNWEVNLSDTWYCSLGKIQIPATQLTFRVNEEDGDKFVWAFRLKFLSAGG
ncbi:hypothetical protein [Desulfosporosinus sp.]|uniref:hypothetical protein n=1 Tax=Desulfosporosinus sp. TaxID=157907 RepID=UPI0025C08753|nr:hypothetical protein [Desulfosporosinus sp.]MBC2728760.1 hypothetical protein [Desulfosporosinus sp.]